jgi:hypothetical protein
MRNHFLLFCSLFLGTILSTHAQKLQLSIEGGAQQSFIPSHTETADTQPCPPGSGFCGSTQEVDIAYSYTNRPAGYVKLNLAYSSSERLQFYHNLGFGMLRFQPTVKLYPSGGSGSGECIERDEHGNMVVVACENTSPSFYRDDRSGRTSLLYLSQELGARYKVGSRLWVQAGMDVSYRLHSQLYAPVLQYSQEDGYTVSMQKDRSGTGFSGILLGVHTGLGYDLTDKLTLSMGLQHSLTPLYTEEMITGKGYEKSRASQLRLGVGYKIKGW